MQSSDARILRGAAIPAGVVGAVSVTVCLLVAGPKGALGAAIATAVVIVFFSVSAIAVSYASKVSAQTMMLAAVASYAVKILAVMVLISVLKNATVWNPRAFAWTVIALVLTWIVAEFRIALKVKAYVDEPAGSGARPAGTTGPPRDRST